MLCFVYQFEDRLTCFISSSVRKCYLTVLFLKTPILKTNDKSVSQLPTGKNAVISH